jgi:3-isopropylmalate/(R)-2-methylmalate dehydratase large subunit
LAHDGTGPVLLEQWGQDKGKRVRCRKVTFTLDHAFPAPTIKDRKFQKDFAEFSREQGCCLYKQGEGVLHQVVAEEESIWPGMLLSEQTGTWQLPEAFGAIAFSVSAEKLFRFSKAGNIPQ